ncbi:hypothetical protein [Mesorhizobium abyssinicae]|uniref:hypothetical protein n=1 Tax=Mesorhizobium abyssinicae TaxID=1209958 RepID=UPI00348766E6
MSSNTIDLENVITIAIELSRSTWLVAARLPGVKKPRLHKIDAGDTTALLAHLSLLRARFAGGQAQRQHFIAASRRGVTASVSIGS